MYIMGDPSQETEKINDIQMGLHSTNPSLQRPKNFSLQRRSDAYYFLNNSPQGILKRVPFRYGDYRLTELETVLEKPNAAKTRHEIWSDVPLNTPGNSEAYTNRTVATNEDSYIAIHTEQKNETVFKSPDKTAGIKLLSHDLKKLATAKDYKDYQKTEKNGKEQLKVINQGPKDKRFLKSFQGHGKKKYQTNVSVPTHSEKFKSSDEKYENISAANGRSTSSKSDETKDAPLNAVELNLMHMKAPITEL